MFFIILQADSTIPASSYLHTVAVTINDEMKYATFAFGKLICLVVACSMDSIIINV